MERRTDPPENKKYRPYNTLPGPLNPSEYEPGCQDADPRNKESCSICKANSHGLTRTEHHRFLCAVSRCYNPKRRTQKFKLWKVPEKQINAFMVLPYAGKEPGRGGLSVFADDPKTLERYGITVTEIEEEVPHEYE